MLLQGWKHENHWVPNLDCMKGSLTLANRTSAANSCVMCSWPLVQKRITLSLKRHIFSWLPLTSISAWWPTADGVTLTFFLGEPDSFHPLHGWSLTGGSEMMDPFLIINNFLWTVCLLLHSVVGNWGGKKKKKKNTHTHTSFFPVCCYLLTHKAALSTDTAPQYAIQIPYAMKWHICPTEWVPHHVHCRLLLLTNSVIHFIIGHFPARCTYVAPLDNLLPGNDTIAIHFQELLMHHMLTLPMPTKNM